MKVAIHITLLTLWVCALTVPCLINIASKGESHIIVMGLGEEEKPEEGKKDKSEEKIIPEAIGTSVALIYSDKSLSTDNYILELSNHTPEIHLPPPERNV
ncbi:MAG: hypothetical protein AB3N14_03560 [Flavobacteriaceae bacterium]